MAYGLFSSNTAPIKPIPIRVGGTPFHAYAVALIDVLHGRKHVPVPLLKKVVHGFQQYFPSYIHFPEYSSALEKMTILLQRHMHSVSGLVERMAFVLRQLVVDELIASPNRYSVFFLELDKKVSEQELREPTCILDHRVVHPAIAHALGVRIILSHVEPEKELRKREEYTCTALSAGLLELNIQVQGTRYFPYVASGHLFTSVGQLAISVPMPEVATTAIDTLAHCKELAAEERAHLEKTYQRWCRTIRTMLQAEEVTTGQLMDLYIRTTPINANATQTLFSPSTEPVVAHTTPSKQHLNALLAHALSIRITQDPQTPLVDMFENIDTSHKNTQTL